MFTVPLGDCVPVTLTVACKLLDAATLVLGTERAVLVGVGAGGGGVPPPPPPPQPTMNATRPKVNDAKESRRNWW